MLDKGKKTSCCLIRTPFFVFIPYSYPRFIFWEDSSKGLGHKTEIECLLCILYKAVWYEIKVEQNKNLAKFVFKCQNRML